MQENTNGVNPEIVRIGEKVLAGGVIAHDEALCLTETRGTDLLLLFTYASKIRERFAGDGVDLCSIVNARSGRCSEDCAFCAQSAHYHADGPVYSLLDEDTVLRKAWEARRTGANRFDMVTNGRGVREEDTDFRRILQILRRVREETGLKTCASLGTLTFGAARALVEAGVTRYNHNIETAESFFSKIVSTHTFAERVETVRIVKAAGMEACCGGIIGLGESAEQRLDFAFTLRELGADSVPVNILNPRAGTPLQDIEPLAPMEILKYLALFRFILPDKIIRYAGGREVGLRELQPLGFLAGVNGMLIGDYLTTRGRKPEEDLALLRDLQWT